jgi:hypothetical protein
VHVEQTVVAGDLDPLAAVDATDVVAKGQHGHAALVVNHAVQTLSSGDGERLFDVTVDDLDVLAGACELETA